MRHVRGVTQYTVMQRCGKNNAQELTQTVRIAVWLTTTKAYKCHTQMINKNANLQLAQTETSTEKMKTVISHYRKKNGENNKRYE